MAGANFLAMSFSAAPRTMSTPRKAASVASFEVLGVSIDQNPDAWKQAIEEDQTPWKHVLDQRNEVAKTFGVSSVPRVFLINPEGIIVAVNLYGKELEQRLEEIFSK